MKLRVGRKIGFFVFLFLLVGFTIWLASFPIEGALKDFALKYGYLGFFVIAFVGGLNIAVPFSPSVVFAVPLLVSGLNPFGLIILGAAGATLADAVGYGLGLTGEAAFSVRLLKFKLYVDKLINKHPRLTPFALLLWASFVPLPNELWVIPAGISKYGFYKTISITFVGNIIFHLLIIWLGAFIVAR